MNSICPRCNVENRDQAKRCMACNQELTQHPPASPGHRPSVRLCPSGRHPMDPGWQVCPYCEADRKAKREAPPQPPAPASPPAMVREIAMPPVGVTPASDRPSQRRKTAFVGALEAVESPPPVPQAPVANPPTPAPPAPLHHDPVIAGEPQRRGTVFAPQGAPPQVEVAATPAASIPPPPVARPAPEIAPPSPKAAGVVGGRRIVGVLVTYSWHREGQIFPVREGRNFLGGDPSCDIAIDADTHLFRPARNHPLPRARFLDRR